MRLWAILLVSRQLLCHRETWKYCGIILTPIPHKKSSQAARPTWAPSIFLLSCPHEVASIGTQVGKGGYTCKLIHGQGLLQESLRKVCSRGELGEGARTQLSPPLLDRGWEGEEMWVSRPIANKHWASPFTFQK